MPHFLSPVYLELNHFIGKPVDHAQAYGRIAFSCPYEEQPTISKLIEESKNKILTPLISLDTPGKATVRVIILADPVSIFLYGTVTPFIIMYSNSVVCYFSGWTRDMFC